MHTISLFFANLLFRTSLFAACGITALVLTVGEPTALKNALANSDAYDRFVDTTISAAQSQSQDSANALPLDDPELQNIIKSSFGSGALLGQTETALDDIYAWLKQDTAQLDFEINLTANKDLLARQIADYAMGRISELPICRAVPETQNIFELTCLPPGLDLSEQRIVIYEAIARSPAFLKDPSIGPDNLPKSPGGKTLPETYVEAPTYYSWFMKFPYLLFFFAMCFAAIVVGLSRTRYRGLRSVAGTLVVTGIVVAIAPFIANYVTPSINQSIQQGLSGGGYGSIINDVSNAVYADINAMLINIAIIIASIGMVMMILVRAAQRRQNTYANLDKLAGVATSISKPPSTTKGIKQDEVPIQSSERNYKQRKPGKSQKKYRKL